MPHVRGPGKGRKHRCTPLRKDAIAALRAWQREQPHDPLEPVFPTARRTPLSRDGVADVVARHLVGARERCPSLAGKRVSPALGSAYELHIVLTYTSTRVAAGRGEPVKRLL